MRVAYALLGVGFIIIFTSSYFFIQKVEAPTLPNQKQVTITQPMSLRLTSPAFQNDGMIPPEYTCDGVNQSPELSFEDVPTTTGTFALVMEDPDIPQVVKDKLNITVLDHFVLYNI